MEFKTATMADFDVAFDYIEKLWTYNTLSHIHISEPTRRT